MTSIRRINIVTALVNLLLLVLYWPIMRLLPIPPLKAFVVAYLIFIAPGAFLVAPMWQRTRDGVMVFLGVLVASTLFSAFSVVFYLVVPVSISPLTQWLLILGVSILGCGTVHRSTRVGLPVKVQDPPRGSHRFAVIGIALWIVVFLASCWAAIEVMPPMNDFDLEAQGTAYGLITTGRAYMLSDRNTYLFYAHPILMNLWTAQSFLHVGQLEDIRYFYDIALEGRGLLERDPVGHEITVTGPEGRVITARVIRKEGFYLYVDRDLPGQGKVLDSRKLVSGQVQNLYSQQLSRFHRRPLLLETRVPALFFAACTPVILFTLLWKQTAGKWVWSLAGSLLYATFPEIFLRSVYGGAGFTGVTNFCFVLMLYLYWESATTSGLQRLRRGALVAAGMLLAWINHKGFFLPVAFLAVELFQGWWRSRSLAWTRSRLWEGTFWGFVLGTLLYWIYGLATDAGQFLLDHVQYHLLNRFTHENVLGYGGYPGIGQLWGELFWSLGAPFLLVAVPLCLYQLKDLGGRRLILPVWFLLGAAVYSAVDWRQTKHLMLIVIPLVVSVVLFASRLSRKWQIGLGGVLGWVILRNLWVIYQVSLDWSYLQPTPAW